MHLPPSTDPRCSFYIRVLAKDSEGADEPSGYYYDPICINSAHHDGYLHTAHPPHVGDLISLYDSAKEKGGQYRVVARSWGHSSYGSVNWPILEPRPVVGPFLDVIVEPAAGAFEDQVLRPDEEEA